MAENQYGFPTEVLSLPSQGLLYPEDSPLRSGTIDVKYMTAKEEDILTSTNLIEQGVVITKLLESVIANPKVKLSLNGHTDNVGDSLHNEVLSDKRARAVADLLVKLGVERTRVSYDGFGWRKPKTTNETLEGRLMNRRVEVQLTNTVLETEETIELKKRD